MRLNIACATNCFPGWVNVDRTDLEQDYFKHIRGLKPSEMHGWSDEQKKHVEWLNEGKLQFFQWDLRKGFPMYADGSIEACYVGQAIEHLNPLHEVPQFLAECHRMLKPGGRIRLTTPDLDLLIDAYTQPNERTAKELREFTDEQPAYYVDALPEDQLAYLMYGAGGTSERYEGHQHLFTRRSLAHRLGAAGLRVAPPDGDLFAECVDKGMSHSFAIEAVK